MIHSYWYIADTPGPALFGIPACKRLAVVQVNCAVMTTQIDRSPTGTAPTQAARAAKPPGARTPKPKCIKSTDDLMREFPDRFIGIGKLPGKYKIQLHPDAHLVIHTPRKCLITLCPMVKEHLAKMEALGVITCIDQPTDWVSSITYIQKANGKLCLCLDLHDLNRAIHHNHHKKPTVEEVTHKFANSCYFTKLDACHGYWSIVLDEELSLLTTFQHSLWEVPFPAPSLWPGLFTRHLPEEDGPVPWRVPWMYRNHQWHHHTCSYWGRTQCPSAEPHAGSPQVWSCVQSIENAHKGPCCKLLWLPIQCQWCPPGPGEGQCCNVLPAPTTVTELQEFLSMVTYLCPFIHGLSTLTAPLQELLRKDANFTWNASYEAAFQQVKQAVISNTTLRYFDPLLPVTIQVDASQVGLGTALLQITNL